MSKENKLIRDQINIKITKEKFVKSKKDKKMNESIKRSKKRKEKKIAKKIEKESKINKKDLNRKGDISRRKKIKIFIIIAWVLFFLLDMRVAYIQFIKGEWLSSKAYAQQTLDRKINPKRGNIYDSTGETLLATSSSVETVTINPLNIEKENKEKVAKKLSELFDLDYDTILKRVNRKTGIENIIKRVEKEKTDELRVWMKNNDITSGINIDEDTKRYYPYNNLASFVLGFCGSDNQGLNGIEIEYNSELEGKQGIIKKMINAKGINIEDVSESYEAPVDGNDLILTIDSTIQGIAEKYLEEACIDNICTDGGNILIMDVNTGDILAMAGYPDYNLNDPYNINDIDLKETWYSMSAEERANSLQQMWRNKAISDTYEPGSTFKLVTASTALEEGIVTSPDNAGEFCCVGHIDVAGVKMKCWRYYKPHGSESLRDALMNSCNPVFIGLGQKIGVSKYYQYLKKYGFLNRTGIDLPGEANSIFLKESKVGPVELGTIAFGQRFEVTPIQMITMVSTIANGGTYIYPRVVKSIINNETQETKDIEIKKGERVISETTSENMLSMMGTVVAEGTGKNAQVKGYSIGGKTGTSEDGVNTGKYVTSFIGVATVENPNIAILITLYNPTGEGGHQGGGVAAPIASQIFGEVLPYLELEKEQLEEVNNEKVEIPNIIGKTLREGKNILLEAGLEINEVKESEDTEEEIIKEQIPVSGINVLKGTKVIIKY